MCEPNRRVGLAPSPKINSNKTNIEASERSLATNFNASRTLL